MSAIGMPWAASRPIARQPGLAPPDSAPRRRPSRAVEAWRNSGATNEPRAAPHTAAAALPPSAAAVPMRASDARALSIVARLGLESRSTFCQREP